MKKTSVKMFAGTSAIALLLAGTCMSADAVSVKNVSTATERSEGYMNYDLSSDTVIVFQKKYDAYRMTASCSGRSNYAEIVITVKRPFIFLSTETVLYDRETSSATISLPLEGGQGSWIVPNKTLKIEDGDVVSVKTRFYTLQNGEKIFDDAATGKVSLCGCEMLQSPSAYDAFYLNGISSEEADYADVKLMVSRLSGTNYITVNTTTMRLNLSGGNMTEKIDSSKLGFSNGDIIALDYTLYNNSQPLQKGSSSVTLSNTPGRKRGDLDGDGRLTKNDSEQMVGFLSRDEQPAAGAEISLRTADLNSDGRISSKDLNILKKMVMTRS